MIHAASVGYAWSVAQADKVLTDTLHLAAHRALQEGEWLRLRSRLDRANPRLFDHYKPRVAN